MLSLRLNLTIIFFCGGRGNRTPEAFTPDCFQDSVLDQPDYLHYNLRRAKELNLHSAKGGNSLSRRAQRTNICLLSKYAHRDSNPENTDFKSAVYASSTMSIFVRKKGFEWHWPPSFKLLSLNEVTLPICPLPQLYPVRDSNPQAPDSKSGVYASSTNRA